MILVIKIEMMLIKLVMAAKGGERGSFEGLPRRLPLIGLSHSIHNLAEMMIMMAMVQKLPLIGMSPTIKTSAMNLKPISNISKWKRNWFYFKQKINSSHMDA